MQTINSKVAGTSHKNEDGEKRQEIIKDYCRRGKRLRLIREPGNQYDSNAISIWVKDRLFYLIPVHTQIGYVTAVAAETVADHMDSGGEAFAKITEITGDTKGKRNRGVNIEITCAPAGTPQPRQTRWGLIAVPVALILIFSNYPSSDKPTKPKPPSTKEQVLTLQGEDFEAGLKKIRAEARKSALEENKKILAAHDKELRDVESAAAKDKALAIRNERFMHTNTTLSFTWKTASFGTVMVADFLITNYNRFPIKDITISCSHYGNSGTRLDTNEITIYEIFYAKRRKRVLNSNVGFIHPQTTKTTCKITAVKKLLPRNKTTTLISHSTPANANTR